MTDVTVFARRAACLDGVAVGVRVEHDRLRLTDVPGEVLVSPCHTWTGCAPVL